MKPGRWRVHSHRHRRAFGSRRNAGFERFKTYDIVDGGKWTSPKGQGLDRIYPGTRRPQRVRISVHEAHIAFERRAGDGHRSQAEKQGTKAIKTSQYNHNFFVLDGQPTGPDASAQFAFDLKPLESCAS